MGTISKLCAVILIIPLGACGSIAAKRAVTDATSCIQTARASEDGELVFARLWRGDGSETDTADKLTDPKPLTKAEREALVRVHAKVLPCRQIIVAHDNQYAAWETPYWQELYQRGDAVYLALVANGMPVGTANRLSIESLGKFHADVSRGHADAVQVEEAQRQRAAEAMIQAGAVLAAQPRPQMTTTNCGWAGNSLNCTSVRQ